jgi:uncharacterized protein (UPF0262 family)
MLLLIKNYEIKKKIKDFTYLGPSYYSSIKLSTTKRFEKLKDEINKT